MTTYTRQTASEDKDVVRKINEVFHDITAKSYVDIHPEIFTFESESWKDLFRALRENNFDSNPLTIVDIGTGTGFVPLVIEKYLRDDDLLIVSDVSSKMLEQAKKLLTKINCKKQFLHVTDNYGAINSGTVNVVTINSVLHHISDIEGLFLEINRILKAGGFVVVKHEPNIRFTKNLILRNIYLAIKRLQKYKYRNIKVTEPAFFTEVIQKLEQEEIFFKPKLTKFDLQSTSRLVDIQSPTAAGGMSQNIGFDPYKISDKYLPGSELISCQTYNYFGKVRDDANMLRNMLSFPLKIIFPKDGYFFDLVIKKN